MAEIIRLDLVRAQLALEKFRPQPHRPMTVDTLYGPTPKGLTQAEVDALKSTGLAEVYRRRDSKEYRVTLTPTGRRERDRTPDKPSRSRYRKIDPGTFK